jgi:hypothetical protein
MKVTLGDIIEFDGKTGRVTKLTSKETQVYVIDGTYGYTISVPKDAQVRVLGGPLKFSKQEDIKKPARYNKRGKLECWDVILDQEMGFLEGNIIKYLWRYKEKNGVEDLKKARVYLDKLISEVEKK